MFWMFLVLAPFGLAILPFVLASGEDDGFSTFLIAAVICVISYGIVVLFALLARWMARGILQGARVRTVFCAMLSGLLGVGCLFMSASMPGEHATAAIGFGLLLLILTIGLLATLWSGTKTE
jgi:hypothetical protein